MSVCLHEYNDVGTSFSPFIMTSRSSLKMKVIGSNFKLQQSKIDQISLGWPQYDVIGIPFIAYVMCSHSVFPLSMASVLCHRSPSHQI